MQRNDAAYQGRGSVLLAQLHEAINVHGCEALLEDVVRSLKRFAVRQIAHPVTDAVRLEDDALRGVTALLDELLVGLNCDPALRDLRERVCEQSGRVVLLDERRGEVVGQRTLVRGESVVAHERTGRLNEQRSAAVDAREVFVASD